MREWIIVQHVPFEGPGTIVEVGAASGRRFQTRRIWAGDPVPTPEEVAGLVVLGGPMGALDDDTHPNLAPERDLIRALVAESVPVLGVCLGAQLLAVSMGGRLSTGPVAEIGAGEVRLTADGSLDPVLGPSGPDIPVMHWHQDTFTLPDGAVRLASTELFANQGFRFGSAYGFQYHVEIDAGAVRAMSPHLPDGVDLDPTSVARIEQSGITILKRLFETWG